MPRRRRALVIAREDIIRALRRIEAPGLREDIVSAGLISEIAISGDAVMFAINVDPGRAGDMEPVRRAAEAAVRSLPGVGRATVVLTAERAPARSPGSGAQ